jgi:predicted MFS family arabinose efflux permease
MSLLQVSWPFSAMLALPIQALIGQSLGWPAVMMFGAIVAGAAFCAFAFISEPSERAPRAAVERSFPISFCLRSSSPARSGAR